MPKLPKGEEKLPIIELEGKLLTPGQLKRKSRTLYQSFTSAPGDTFTYRLMIERMRRRVAQGRVLPIYRLDKEISPGDQLRHMEQGDEIGQELILSERKLLEEELRILRGK
jgi:hypothetical protein